MTKLGAIFPQTEIGNDTGAIREFAQATESLGFDFLLAFDHVLGANAETHTELTGPYRHYDAFHEPFVLFRLPCGGHKQRRACHRHHHPTATPDCARSQAGCGGRCPQRRTPTTRNRSRLELCGVRGAWRELAQPRRSLRRADRCHAPALDERTHYLRRQVAQDNGRRYSAAACAAAHPRMAWRRIRPHSPPNRQHRRRLDTNGPPRRPRQRSDRQAALLRRGSGARHGEYRA